jgi:mono/diheme cytochrome c family protein
MRLLVLVMLVSGIAANEPMQSDTRSVRDGVYTDDQAARGATLYSERCASCHQIKEFTGHFLGAWKGRPVDGLFEMMSTSMPVDEPGSLSREQNADLLAFILKSNGFAAGERELESTPAALAAVLIDVPPGQH